MSVHRDSDLAPGPTTQAGTVTGPTPRGVGCGGGLGAVEEKDLATGMSLGAALHQVYITVGPYS